MKILDGNRNVRLAAAQIECVDCDVPANLVHAQQFVKNAAKAGADLLVFPEFMPEGFRLTNELWDTAEPTGGPTEQWLTANAREYGMYIGTSYLEARNGQFYNTFALAEPKGSIAGRVYKRHPSLWEAYFFTGGNGNHFIDTELGRIGVGICFDNHTHDVACKISSSNVDIMLMPHSYFTPMTESKLVSTADIERLNGLPEKVAELYNQNLGVPVLMVNKSGKWDSPVPTKMFPVAKENSFPGCSVIIDSDGRRLVKLNAAEGLALADVKLVESRKKHDVPARYGRYIYPGSIGREYIRFAEWLGRRSYAKSAARRQKAERFMAGNGVEI